ncbi:MAG TPA: SpoIIIAH-like family protein [Anaerovoracaceae bacterium]|nr:SpoIIIAH-like family protein [Anaerovoracaceae bacterium]
MEFFKRKKIILVGMLVLIVVIGAVNHRLSNDQNLAASAGYTEYELDQMSLHDGDVLVDSINVTGVPGASSGSAVDTGAPVDTVVVDTTAADPNAPADAGAPADMTAVDPNAPDAGLTFSETPIVDTIAGFVPGAGLASTAAAANADFEDILVVTSDDISELANADVYFEEVRATINMDRNQIISMLTDVIEETAAGSAEQNNATQQKLKIINYMNTEKVVENLIKNKGFTDALVLMTDNSVNVMVNKQEITQSDVAKICDIVMRETGRNAGQIVIQSKY